MKPGYFRFRCRLEVLLLTCLVAIGCSPNVKVTGTVTFSDNNEPVKFGTVLFAGEKEIGRGTINNGRYSAGLLKDGEGIPPGTYTISADLPYSPYVPLSGPPVGSIGVDGAPAQAAEPMPREQEYYSTKEPKTIDIKKSMTYDFQVERILPPH
jgi:hypothetical protein